MASLTGLSDRIAYILCGAAGFALTYVVGSWLVAVLGREFSILGFVGLWLLWSVGLSLIWHIYSPFSGRNIARRRARKAAQSAAAEPLAAEEKDGG